jgi:sugar lactone lactonase YvrE
LAIGACCVTGFAQRDPVYDNSVVPQVRIDLRDLGYPPADVIPADESAIRSLTVAPGGAIFGATSGDRSHLFVLEPQHGYVRPLGRLPGKTVHHALVADRDGSIYIGTASAVDDDGAGYKDYPGGHLLQYQPTPGRNIQIDADCPVKDLGIPVKGQGIYALAIDRGRGVIYGVTYPDGEFFSYDIHAAAAKSYGRVAARVTPGEKFQHEKNIGRALALDGDGNVFTTGDDGALFRFTAKSHELERLQAAIPSVPGREVYNRVDAWAASGSGDLYGGTSDGYLFRFDPSTLRVENLGKPLNEYRIRGLVFGRNRKLYGIGGDGDENARLFSYDPATGGYQIVGMIDVNHRPYYSWQGYVFDSMVARGRHHLHGPGRAQIEAVPVLPGLARRPAFSSFSGFPRDPHNRRADRR